MQTTALSFQNMHAHGELFTDVLKARRDSFFMQRNWDLPEVDGMEFDQYATPQSRWIAVHHLGEVMAGVRLTPTTARCGIYSYMIRDAQMGLLETIPQDLLFENAPVAPHVWEVTRGFVAHNIPSTIRRKVHTRLVMEMVRASRAEGINQMVALLPSNWSRWAKRCALDMAPAGRVMDMGGINYQAVSLDFTAHLH